MQDCWATSPASVAQDTLGLHTLPWAVQGAGPGLHQVSTRAHLGAGPGSTWGTRTHLEAGPGLTWGLGQDSPGGSGITWGTRTHLGAGPKLTWGTKAHLGAGPGLTWGEYKAQTGLETHRETYCLSEGTDASLTPSSHTWLPFP